MLSGSGRSCFRLSLVVAWATERGSGVRRNGYQKLEGEYLFATRSIAIFSSPLQEEVEVEGGKTPMVKDG